MSTEAHRQSLNLRLSMVREDIDRIRDATTPEARRSAAIDAHSALGHAAWHINGLLRALGLEPLREIEAEEPDDEG
jgi:hypothetical protein